MALQVSITTLFERLMEAIVGRGRTITVNDFVSLKLGEPLSVTRTVIMLVVFASESAVFQTRRPLVDLIVAPEGAPGSRL